MALVSHRLWPGAPHVRYSISYGCPWKWQLAENAACTNLSGLTRDSLFSRIASGVSARTVSCTALPQTAASGRHEDHCMVVADGVSSADSLKAYSTIKGRRWLLGVMAAFVVGLEAPKSGAMELPRETESEYEEDEQRTVQLFQVWLYFKFTPYLFEPALLNMW